MIKIARSESLTLYPAELLEMAFKKYYPNEDIELYCEPYIEPQKAHWSFDNYRCSGALQGGFPLFYTQPGWGANFDKMGRTNNKCVTYACDPEIHKPVDIKKTFDVGFIGSGSSENCDRDEYLQAINVNFNALIRDDVLSKDLSKEYSKCKVIFNHIRYEEINIRFFEGLALGAMVVSYTPCLHYFAQEEKHYLSFRSVEEAISQINFLLEHDKIREKMAKDARKHVIKYHTYKNRAEEMLSFIRKVNNVYTS